MQTVKIAASALVAFAVLDGVWLGLVMKGFYRSQLAPIARMADDGLAPIWPAAILVYVLLAVGVTAFVIPRAVDTASAAGLGALLGLVVYGVYDLTNYATLTEYPLALTLVDICWGTVATAVASAVVRAIS